MMKKVWKRYISDKPETAGKVLNRPHFRPQDISDMAVRPA